MYAIKLEANFLVSWMYKDAVGDLGSSRNFRTLFYSKEEAEAALFKRWTFMGRGRLIELYKNGYFTDYQVMKIC